MQKRFMAFVIVVFVMFAVVMVNIVRIYITKGEEYTQQALSQVETTSVTLSAKRGDITDINGITLATSTQVYNLILDPELILTDEETYLEPTVAALSECYGYSEEELTELIYANPNSHYIVLQEELTYTDTVDFLEMQEEDSDINGVFMESSYKRNYAYGTLACSVLGFVEDGEGAYGLEYEYDDILTGIDGSQYTYVNSENVVETVTNEAQDGETIRTTIDYNIQAIVEEKIEEYFEEGNIADTVAVIVQDPNTGAILAMADSNNFDPNDPRDLSSAYTEEEIEEMSDEETVDALSSLWSNFCISSSYEPGSTFKPFTLAAALEEGTTELDTTYYCGGSLDILDYTVSCHNTSGDGTITAAEGIALSCNVTLMQIAQELGAEEFSEYQSDFGFGSLTGIDLPGELSCSGLLYDADDMSILDLSTNSFGQNFNVTMIQLSTAFCSLINGGYYYQPYIVDSIYNSSGDVVNTTESILVSRPISEETSDEIKQALRMVVTEGTGTKAAVDGYVISGKTGTAQKNDKESEENLVSFIGFAPYEDPQVVCYVVIDVPEEGEGGSLAAALFSDIMSEILPYLNVTGEEDDTDPEADEEEDSEETEEETAVTYYEEEAQEEEETEETEGYTEETQTEAPTEAETETETTQEETTQAPEETKEETPEETEGETETTQISDG